MGLFQKIFGTYSERELKSIYPIADQIEALADEYKALSDAELQAKTPAFKERLANGETLDFRDDAYRRVAIDSFERDVLHLQLGGTLPLADITRIEELDD